jgi:hypothetical protein
MNASAQFGQSLRAARERCGLSVEQLSQATTIPVADIESIEAGAVSSLPRAMYRRAEVRAYAEAVGLDPHQALEDLRDAVEDMGSAPIGAPASPVRSTPGGDTAPRVSSSDRPRLRLVAPAVAAGRSRDARMSDTRRAGRAAVVLLIGCGVLLMNRDGASPPPTDDVVSEATMIPAVKPQSVIDEAVRIAEPTVAAPTLRRVLYEPRIAANGQRGAGDARLDGGVLVVRSTPSGARVTVNGVGWGETPVAIRYLPMGLLRVRVAKPDYRTQERTVLLTYEQPSTMLRLSLPQLRRQLPAPVTAGGDALVITSVPAGARVTVNGIGWGTTPLSIPHLPAGTQRVRLVKEQFRSEERLVHVGGENKGRLDVTLKPQS